MQANPRTKGQKRQQHSGLWVRRNPRGRGNWRPWSQITTGWLVGIRARPCDRQLKGGERARNGRRASSQWKLLTADEWPATLLSIGAVDLSLPWVASSRTAIAHQEDLAGTSLFIFTF